jgi:ABC-type multidrug transport system fused ATPase/permease subunit
MAYGKEEMACERFTETSKEFRKCSIKANVWGGIMGPCNNLINNLNYLIVAAFGGYFAIHGQILIGDIQSILQYSRQLSQPINAVANLYAQIMTAIAGAERIFNILDTPDEIDEGDNASALKVDAQNHLSVEAGVGLNLRKDVELSHKSRLSFKAGAMYYHEFAKPYYDLDASMNGMSGSYNITDYERVYDRDRAVLSGQIDFSYKPFTFYGKFKQFIEDDNPFEVNAGIKFNF